MGVDEYVHDDFLQLGSDPHRGVTVVLVRSSREVDLAVHPVQQNPFDPFTGRLVTRLKDGEPFIAEADEHVLLGCDFLWDVVANRELFDPWCRLTPPVTKLEALRNFHLAPGVSTLSLGDVPTNRPTLAQSWMICKDWTFRITLPGRPAVYKIGKFRPSINAMEASWLHPSTTKI